MGWAGTSAGHSIGTWSGHIGQTGDSHGFIGLDQARHVAVVVLSNAVSSIDDIGFHLLDVRVELAAAEERQELTLAPEGLGR